MSKKEHLGKTIQIDSDKILTMKESFIELSKDFQIL